MDKYLWGTFFSLSAALSGSVIYIVGKDLYKVNIENSTKNNEGDLKDIKQYLNPGLILGLSLGITNIYLDKPILNYICPRLNVKMIKD
jgi:hypothetical protein